MQKSRNFKNAKNENKLIECKILFQKLSKNVKCAKNAKSERNAK